MKMTARGISGALLLIGASAQVPEEVSFVSSPAVPLHTRWEAFKRVFDKAYSSIIEHEQAMRTFADNDKFIHNENSNSSHGYVLGHTKFSDLTPAEFKQRMGVLPMPERRTLLTDTFQPVGALPDSVDWVSKGAVTAVKNQGSCGGCWAFSSTGAIEGAFVIAGNGLQSFSEEMLINCDAKDHGCSGGVQAWAFDWVKANGGLCTEEAYPFTDGGAAPDQPKGTCKKSSCKPVVTVSGYKDIVRGDEKDLLAAVSRQPVSVGIDAGFAQFYHGGVYDGQCGNTIDHGVLVVGYGTEEGKDYWKLKNSWDTTWGEKGYFRLARGRNLCALTGQAFYPVGVTSVGPVGPPTPSPPTPPAAPTPAGPSGSFHYEKPGLMGCNADEEQLSLQEIQGVWCSPKCSSTGSCPTDVPPGVTAKPSCVLPGGTLNNCGLVCTSNADCGQEGSCQSTFLGNICTYPPPTSSSFSPAVIKLSDFGVMSTA